MKLKECFLILKVYQTATGCSTTEIYLLSICTEQWRTMTKCWKLCVFCTCYPTLCIGERYFPGTLLFNGKQSHSFKDLRCIAIRSWVQFASAASTPKRRERPLWGRWRKICRCVCLVFGPWSGGKMVMVELKAWRELLSSICNTWTPSCRASKWYHFITLAIYFLVNNSTAISRCKWNRTDEMLLKRAGAL